MCQAIQPQPVAVIRQTPSAAQNRHRQAKTGCAGDQEHDQELIAHRFRGRFIDLDDHERIAAALQDNGGSWEEWARRLEPFRQDLRLQLQASGNGIINGLATKPLVKEKFILETPADFPVTGLDGQGFDLK